MWLFWFVVVGIVAAVLIGIVAAFFYPVRQRHRTWSASHHRDVVSGDWMNIPATRKELWRRS